MNGRAQLSGPQASAAGPAGIGFDSFGTRPQPLPGADTFPKVFFAAARLRGEAVMFREKKLGLWTYTRWSQALAVVEELGLGLIELGLAAGETVSVLSNTRSEWIYSDIAAQAAGAVVSGIYPTDSAEQVQFLCEDSGSVFLFVEDEEQLDKFLAVADRLPRIRKIVVYDMEGLHDLDDPRVVSYEALLEAGRAARGRLGELEARCAAGTPEKVAILVYTSGTTGKPKGTMLTQGNVVSAVRSLFEVFPDVSRPERMAFLPLCHVGERVIGCYYAIFAGHRLNFVEDPNTVFENMREVQPGIFMAVPRVWEKLYSAVHIALNEATALERLAARLAFSVGEKVAARRIAWQPVPLHLRAGYWLARVLVLNNLRRFLGVNRVEVASTGAAPISPDLIRWFLALGVEIQELWGMSELAGVSSLVPKGKLRPGSIGVPLPNMRMRIAEDGEIQVQGTQVFSGYLGQPEKTAETFQDGWLCSGDIGRVDELGYFYITDRKKDIIITAGGKNVTPSEWENQLKFSPYITDAVVIGDKRKYLTCLVMIDQENVEHWALDRQVDFTDYRSLTRAPEVRELIADEVEKVNARFARVEQVKDFRLIDILLSAEDEEVTPTMKLKRKFVEQKYAHLIEEMYPKG